MSNSLMTGLQRLGKALMGAVAVMPVAALLMGVGYWIQSVAGADNLLSVVLLKSGGAVLDNLGWLFAIALAFGLAKDSNGAAALSGFLGFATVTLLLSPQQVAVYKGMDPASLDSLTGEEALTWAQQGWDAVGDKNVLFGILVGVLAAWVYNRFSDTRLPDFLAFFSGRRLVPILTALFSIVLAGVLYVLWPFVYSALFHFGTWIQGMGAIGAGLYGFFNRLLVPTGLHHALNSIFWFDVIGINDIGTFLGGAETVAAAQAATDAASCPGVWDGQACRVVGVVGQYQAGFFPIMMFGLPGAALAMMLRADARRRKVVGSLMAAGALASFFTGVTEPLEFSFMFAAPLLYLVHAVLTGLSLAIAAACDWTAGFGFSAGLVDMVLSASNPLAHHWWMLLVLGLIFSGVYFAFFYVLIGALNLQTPGRGEEDEDPATDATATITDAATITATTAAPATTDDELAAQAAEIIAGLGGLENIAAMEHCTTRLRVTTQGAAVDDEAIKKTGVIGVIHPGEKSVQVIVGLEVQFLYDEVMRQLQDAGASTV